MRRDTGNKGSGEGNPNAFGDPSWILGKARLLRKFLLGIQERILLGYGCRIAPWTDDVAVSFVINSGFPVVGEENDLKSGPL
jgi:hypothetical protein